MSSAPDPAGAELCVETGKVTLTKSTAKSTAKRISRGRPRGRHERPVEAFKCEACKGWHVGHRSRVRS